MSNLEKFPTCFLIVTQIKKNKKLAISVTFCYNKKAICDQFDIFSKNYQICLNMHIMIEILLIFSVIVSSDRLAGFLRGPGGRSSKKNLLLKYANLGPN